MKKLVLSSLLIVSFCNSLFSDNNKKSSISQGVGYLLNNPVQTLGGIIIGGSTLYGAHQLGVENFLWQLSKGLTHYEHYPKALIGLATAYWIKYFSHFYKLDEINKKISEATINKENTEGLYWSIWKLDSWKTAREIIYYKKGVSEVLKNEIKTNVSKKEKMEQIQREKKQLQEWIRYAGAFTSFPDEFVKEVEDTKTNIEYTSSIIDSANASKKAICAAQHLKDLDISLDEDAFNSSLIEAKNDNSYFYANKWYHPLTWTLAPWPSKARMLCAKLIRLYGRLCALEEIIGEFKVDISPVSEIKDLNHKVKIEGDLKQILQKKDR